MPFYLGLHLPSLPWYCTRCSYWTFEHAGCVRSQAVPLADVVFVDLSRWPAFARQVFLLRPCNRSVFLERPEHTPTASCPESRCSFHISAHFQQFQTKGIADFKLSDSCGQNAGTSRAAVVLFD